MEIPLLQDIVVIFGVSVVVLYLCHRIHLPVIVGFLLTGVFIGPHGLGFVKSVHEVEILAEIGVVLLLFTIGIEFSLKTLLQVKKPVLLGGTLQVLVTLLAAYAVFRQLTLPEKEAVFLGCLLALSSTAIVLRILQERAEIDSPYGRMVLSILIFQDIAIVPMMILAPFLAEGRVSGGPSPVNLLLIGVALIAFVVLSARYLVPAALHQIVRTRSRELFLLTTVLICFAVAWITSLAGLSLGLGAFLAGLVISESEYSHEALDGILPFRDVFTSFFFISAGMLLDIHFLFSEPFLIVMLVVAVLFLKTVVAMLVTLVLGVSLRSAILVGLSLSQVGEFSFILSKTGLSVGLIAGSTYQLFLAVSVLTMAATPFIILAAPGIADRILRLPWPERLKRGAHPLAKTPASASEGPLKNHLIIIGYGINGRNLSRAARAVQISYQIIEMNADTVRKERQKGEPIHYGDATNEAVLRHTGIQAARVLVIAISDPAATGRITQLVRRLNPALYIIVRTRYVREMEALYRLGADAVIPEEFETSVEIFTRVLVKYLVSRDEIEQFIAEIRSERYQMFRSLPDHRASVLDLKPHLAAVEINSLRVAEQSPLVGKTLAELDLRKKYGLTLLAIEREEQILGNPAGNARIETGDLLILLGPLDNINQMKVTDAKHNDTGKLKH